MEERDALKRPHAIGFLGALARGSTTMKVLVTGANGHLGYNLCKALLEQGCEVRGSIRLLADDAKAAPLRALSDIELVDLDVRNAEAFARAAKGVEVLFHAAATYVYHTSGREQDAEMVRDSVEGAENALRAAAGAGVRKVVLTSSTVTLPPGKPGAPPATERGWLSDLSIPYWRAKVMGEKTAWRFADELGVNLVTILPPAIVGPGFHRRTPSTDLLEGIMLGTMRLGAPKLNLPLVDVRDAVKAHILAAQKDVSGRFIICNDRLPSFIELTRMMHGIDPVVPAAPGQIPSFALGLAPFFDAMNYRLLGSPRVMTPELVASIKGKSFSVSTERAKAELGWKQEIPLEHSLADTMHAIRTLRRQEGHTRMA
jgi:dihydroflavonol-4-reductase